MKYLLIALLFSISAAISQVTKNASDSTARANALKIKIKANYDTMNVMLDEKLPKKSVYVTKIVHSYSVKERVVYRDTCLNHTIDHYIFERVPDTLSNQAVPIQSVKRSWLYKLLHKKR